MADDHAHLAPVTSLRDWRSGARRDADPDASGTAGADPTPRVDPATRAAALEAAEQRALAALRRGDRSREELRRDLAGDAGLEAEGLDAADIDALLDRLTDLGYVDDERMAEHLADRLTERKRLGTEGLRRALRERRLDDAAIASVLAERDRDDEFDRAAELASDRAERMRGLDHDTAMRRLVAFLQRRGYGQGVAVIAAGEALTGSASVRPGRRGSASVFFGNADD